MIDDFMLRALAAGIGAALSAGPLGCFVVWRRLAYFGDTMAHSALLGLALGFLMNVEPVLGIFVVTVGVAALLMSLERWSTVPTDTLLGILSHGALAMGLVAIGLMSWLRVDLMGMLFGDVLAVSDQDIMLIYTVVAVVLVCLWWIWEPLLAATVSSDLAQAEGLGGSRASLVFTLLLALVIAVAIKVVGVLLITSLLILPAAGGTALDQKPGGYGDRRRRHWCVFRDNRDAWLSKVRYARGALHRAGCLCGIPDWTSALAGQVIGAVSSKKTIGSSRLKPIFAML